MEVPSSSSSNIDPVNYIETNESIIHLPSKVVIEDITMELHCPLCNDWFCDPLMLSCGHNFCQACIQNFWRPQAKETFCPECKMLCQYSNCTFNLVLDRLAEKIKKLHLLKGHPKCPEHGENLKLFSKPDGKLTCFQCKDARLSVGQSKEFLQISDAVRFFSEELATQQGQLEATLKELQSLRKKQMEAIVACKENELYLQQHVSTEFLKLHKFLDSKEENILTELQEEGKALNEEMELNLSHLQKQCVLAKDMLVSIQAKMEEQNSFDFLKDIVPLLDSLKQGMSVLATRELISRNLNPGQYKGPIQYMVWREMHDTLSPVAEGGTISDPRAADFLFSSDASHPDTLRIYQSLDYIEDNATVFHAYYLSAVANAEIKNSVALGHFILPPACLQKEIRRKIGSFIWEQDQHFLIEKHDEVTANEIKALRESRELATEHKKELSKSFSPIRINFLNIQRSITNLGKICPIQKHQQKWTRDLNKP
uniref:Tripartite motif containing 69 n=1 Tax=Callithrix jacchus TaxID=9483 RepID=F6WVB3_CALJA